MPALPVAIATKDLHIIPSAVLEKVQLPSDISMTKLYWSDHVESLKDEFLSVKELGSSAAEEWFKGLEGRGRELRQDSARWEKFALSGGAEQMRTTSLFPGYRPQPTPEEALVSVSTPKANATEDGALSSDGTPKGDGQVPQPSRGMPQSRAERTKEKADELKAVRRHEIERRAMLLDPPISAAVLSHMTSFQAAVQITTSLDDNAWDVLKPRLLAQRQEAEQREKEHPQSLAKQEPSERRHTEDLVRQREIMDKDWEDVQAPVRARISGFADDIIRDAWDDGDKVTREKCAKFAAEVLLHVRKKFYDAVAEDAAAARAAGQEPQVDPPQGPFTQKLTLENMKWIFDTKIKPHTEQYRKELFLCNGCENNFKYYGFEGVIQHYAAKHTSELSQGSVVVFWRSEWPEHPPFNPEGRPARSSYYQPGIPQFGPAGAPLPQLAYNHYQQPPQPQPPPQPYPAPAGPSYGPPQYGDPYAPQQGYAVPGSYPTGQQGYANPQPYSTPATPYPSYPPPAATPTGPYPPPIGAPTHAYGPPAPPGPPIAQSGIQTAVGPYNYSYNAYQGNGQHGQHTAPTAPFQESYHTLLEDMARNARELWSATSAMKDFPGGARVHTVIYHLAKRFRTRFSQEPPLRMFIDGLSNNKDMRPVRNINGLMCKTCHSGQGSASALEPERRSFSLPQLTNHFQSKHIDPALMTGHGQPPDWTTDMVLLPDIQSLASLQTIVGADNAKYHLIAEAIPQIFEVSSVPVSSYEQAQPEPAWQNNQAYPPEGGASIDNHDRFYAQPLQNQSDSYSQYTPYASSSTSYPVEQADANRLQGVSASSGQHIAPEMAASKFDDSQRKSSQGHRLNTADHNGQQGRQGNSKKKSKGRNGHGSGKRGGGGGGGVDDPNVSDESKAARARQAELNEEAAKQAEEEERRQEEEIRAMWAADRAQAARNTAASTTEASKAPKSGGKSSQSNTPSGQPSKSRTPQQPPSLGRSAQRQEHAGGREEPNLLDMLEMHLDREHPGAYQPPPRPPPAPQSLATPMYQHQPSKVIYMDGRQEIAPSRDPERYPRSVDHRLEMERERSRSPVYIRYAHPPPPVQQYRERSPPPARQVEPMYHPSSRGPPPPLEEIQYERGPRQEYYRVYTDEVRPRPVEYETAYEIVQVRDAEGDYYIRRPIRREAPPPPEPARYYAYEDERPVRREPEPQPYLAYERVAYSRDASRPPSVYLPVSHSEPSGSISRSDPAYYEEYDPRAPQFPSAAPHPPAPPMPGGGRQVRYQ